MASSSRAAAELLRASAEPSTPDELEPDWNQPPDSFGAPENEKAPFPALS
jgi:hypothetical protein